MKLHIARQIVTTLETAQNVAKSRKATIEAVINEAKDVLRKAHKQANKIRSANRRS